MCGILAASRMRRPFGHRLMSGLLKRGPDQLGFWTDGVVYIAHARLAIIGLDERSREPMENERHVLAYNGEVYNYGSLHQRLMGDGVAVRGVNDAEVLLHAWTHYGPSVLSDLEGFWAFVVYDKQKRTLTLVRDQFGVKPLYYYSGESVSYTHLTLPTIYSV